MCLLVEQKQDTQFDDAFLRDVYSKNRDGIGIMYAEGGKVVVKKLLPKTAQDFVEFYRQYADGRDCIWHARMQTHGDIDLENCHPYMVTKNIWMAHNGILSSGNDNDKTKSDTWHFIRHVIEPAVSYNPALLLDPTYQAFLGDLIGNGNKFGFMTHDGTSVIINRSAGVTFQGAWLSNTYAWSAGKYGFGAKTTGTSVYSSYGSRYAGEYTYYDWEEGYSYNKKSKEVSRNSPSEMKVVVKAAYNSWLNNNLLQWVNDAPWKASALLEFAYESAECEDIVADDPVVAAQWIEELFTEHGLTPFNMRVEWEMGGY